MNDSHTDILISIVFVQFVVFVYLDPIEHTVEMLQESQRKRRSAQKRVAGNYTHLSSHFLNISHSIINKLNPFYIEQVQNISTKLIYRYFFGTMT